LPPQRYPPTEIHHSRAYLPGSRCVHALTMCLDAFLPPSAPWCLFNQVRSRDKRLQSLTKRRSLELLSPTSPLAISTPDTAYSRRLSLLKVHLPEIGGSEDLLVGRARRLLPLGSMMPKRATSAQGIAALRGLASGVFSLRRLETPPLDFSFVRRPGSPGLHPPWGIPLPLP